MELETKKLVEMIYSHAKQSNRNKLITITHDENQPKKKPKVETYNLNSVNSFLSFGTSMNFCITGPLRLGFDCWMKCPLTKTAGGVTYYWIGCYEKKCATGISTVCAYI